MTILLPGEERGLDPFTASYANVADGNRLSALYDVLVWTDPTTGAVRPKLAESLVSDDSAREWTLTLRPDVRFSDGSVLDAATVKANWQAHQDPSVRSLVGGPLRGVVLTELDPLRLGIRLPVANANFDHTVARNLAIVAPRRLVETPEGRLELRRAPVGAGPFMLVDWQPGREMRMERNPHYWQKNRPYLDEVVFRVDKNIDDANKAIATNKADLTITTDPENIDRAREDGLAVDDSRLNGGLMMAFNLRRAPFRAPEARRAAMRFLSEACSFWVHTAARIAVDIDRITSRQRSVPLGFRRPFHEPPRHAAHRPFRAILIAETAGRPSWPVRRLRRPPAGKPDNDFVLFRSDLQRNRRAGM